MYRAILICDLKNPISVSYSKLAMKSWEQVEGVKVERWQCYTPDTMYDAPFEIQWGEFSSAGKYARDPHRITPTEKACLTSMFHWWKHIADTGERVLILEHDAFVRDVSKLNVLLKIMPQTDLWNPGIACECISLSKEFAEYCMKKWLKLGDVIDAGPLAELWTANQEWQRYLKERPLLERNILKELNLKNRSRTMWPTMLSNNTLGVGNDLQRLLDGKLNRQSAPVTQVYCPGKNTLEHHSRKGGIEYGSGTYNQMEIIDDLKQAVKKIS